MARVATHLLASAITPVLDVGLYNVNRNLSIASAAANNGDYMPVLTVQRDGRITGVQLAADATLGASCTIKVAQYRGGVSVRDLTVATTAGGASRVSGITLLPQDVLAGDEIVLVVGGANIGAAAGVNVDVQLQH